MTTDAETPDGMPSAKFEAALRSLVLDSFANGAAVEGTWEFTTPESVVPNWRVTIEKTDDAAPPTGDGAFLDE